MTKAYESIYKMVCKIPQGKVATYGQIARLVDMPRGARQIGYALSNLPDTHDVPWHRVVNAKGEISLRSKAGYEDYQRALLEDEGIGFHLNGRIDLKRFLWDV